MKQNPSSPSFADVVLGQRKVKQAFFSQIDKLRPLQNTSLPSLFIPFIFLYFYRMKQNPSSPSFADVVLGQRKVKQTFFSQIETFANLYR